jgi:uncharacterized membrane protein YedE/YeeE
VKPVQLGAILVGALLFGVGMAVLGYCPGTTIAAIREGRRDAVAGFAGMLAGAAVFVAGYRQLEQLQKSIADWGEVTWPQVTATSPWPWVIALGLVALAAWAVVRRRGAPPRVGKRGPAASWA